jgi:hypothetical protein
VQLLAMAAQAWCLQYQAHKFNTLAVEVAAHI